MCSLAIAHHCLVTAIALHGVELANASDIDLARVETQTIKAIWGPASVVSGMPTPTPAPHDGKGGGGGTNGQGPGRRAVDSQPEP